MILVGCNPMSVRSDMRGQLSVKAVPAGTFRTGLALNSAVRASTRNLCYAVTYAMLFAMLTRLSHAAPPKTIDAERLADLPNTPGLAAPYVGVAGGRADCRRRNQFSRCATMEKWHENVA